jgi:hypothetical protein
MANKNTTSQISVTTDPMIIAMMPSTHAETARLRPPRVPGELSIRLTEDLPRKYASVPRTMPGMPSGRPRTMPAIAASSDAIALVSVRPAVIDLGGG